jgi:hypothetical protein
MSFNKNPITEINWIEKPDDGELLLKMTLRVIQRQHDGECSDYQSEFSSDDYKSDIDYKSDDSCALFDCVIENKIIYFKIPDNFDMDCINEDGYVIENEDNEEYFLEWKELSNCEGSHVCNLMDTCIPIKIEYVKIVL